jgi:hypothetical protein
LETTTTPIRFRMLFCERCGREMVAAWRGEAEDSRICSGCEPAAFERAAFEAGRQELLR